MTENAGIHPPTGLKRALFRLPIWFYRIGLGGLLGKRFLRLRHIGRNSGEFRYAVLEVVDHDPASGVYWVASGYGRQAQWYQNLQRHPLVQVQVGWRKFAARAELLTLEESGEAMADYAQRNPKLAKGLMNFLGYEVDNALESYRQLGRTHIPFVAFYPV